MPISRPRLPLMLVIAACLSVTACANPPAKQAEMDYRTRPLPSAQRPAGTPGDNDQRLTIQAGEGERLNLPWFIRDTQDMINRQ